MAGEGGVAQALKWAGDEGVEELQEPDVVEAESCAANAGTDDACTIKPSAPTGRDTVWLTLCRVILGDSVPAIEGVEVQGKINQSQGIPECIW
jgi:hypothetical protein